LRTLVSRSGVPGVPRKYFEATTLVASIDQDLGTSMFFCSKTDLAVLAGDAGGPVLPGHLVGRIHSRGGEEAPEGEAAAHRRLPLLACFRSFDAGDFSSRSMDSPQSNR
jgi:hypothetical protein